MYSHSSTAAVESIEAEGISEHDFRLLVLDGHSLAFRAFYALPAEKFITSTGQVTNAVYGFVSMLINLLKEEQPTHMLCAFDESGPTFRSELFPEYKAHRPATPPEFHGQVTLIQEVVQALGIRYYSTPGFEADDIIASTITQANKQKFISYIVTGDRDLLQLVNESTTVLYPKRGTSDMVRFTPEEVESKYGLSPQQYPDFAALRGDPSDNLPSIPKVGEKTAAKWIHEYGNLDELISQADRITGTVGQSFRDHLGQVIQNRRLTELRREVTLPFQVDDLLLKQWNREEIHRIFNQLEFATLRDRLFKLVDFDEPAATENARNFNTSSVKSGKLGEWLAAQANAQDINTATAIEILGDSHVQSAHVETLIIATASGEVWAGRLSDLDTEDTEALAAWLTDPAIAKVAFNSKGIAHALANSSYTLAGIVMDIELAAYILNPGQRRFSLGDLTLRYLHQELTTASSGASSDQLSLSLDNTDIETAKVQACAIQELSGVLGQELTDMQGLSLLERIELPVQKVLYKMEKIGIAVDKAYLHDLLGQFSDMVDSAADHAWDLIGERINLNSPKQLQTVLFDQLQMPKTKKIKTGYTTDADALMGLYEKTSHPFLQYLLEHREAQKLKTSVEGLISAIGTDDRIHSTFNQTIAATGRLSSTDPNLQNIHVRNPAGKMIRSAFIAGKGYETLLTADYSQIEMRIMAHLSEDEGLIFAFNSGEDLHSYVGSQAFGVPIDEVTPELRRRVKAMSYGLAYGLSTFGLANQLKISNAEAEAQMKAYFSRFGKVRDYLHNVVAKARNMGYTETMYGRRRYFPDLNSQNRQRREIAERAALNSPIQGSAADIIKAAMIEVDKVIMEKQLNSRLLLQIHDELIIEVAFGEKDLVAQLVQEKMSSVISLSVPLEVSLGFGKTWNEAAHDA